MPTMFTRRSAPRSPYRRRLVTAKNVGSYGAMVRDEYGKRLASRRAMRTKAPARQMFKKKLPNPMIRRKPIPAQGGMPSFSQFKLTKRPSARVATKKKVTAANYYVTNNAYQILANEGFQEIADQPFQSLVDLKQIALNVPNTSGIPPAEYVLESTVGEFMITNSSLATAYVDIYDVIRKRDVGIANNTTQSPGQAWQSGVADENNGGILAYRNINSLPTDSRLLKDYFKIVRRTHVGLAQGATHRHSVKLKANELIDTALLKSVSGDIAGVTVYTMISVYGQPASVPEAGVTTAKIALDIVRTVRYKYTWVADNTNSFVFVDNLITTAGEEVVSAGAGAIVPNAVV